MIGTVRQLLRIKGDGIWSVAPSASVYEALETMADKDVGALVVMEKEKLVGIFSERDYARKVVLHGKSSKDTTVREMMTSMVLYATPDRTVDDCMEMMTEKHIRHLPVVEDGRVVGMVTIGDVVKTVISKQQYLISHLERYINGGR